MLQPHLVQPVDLRDPLDPSPAPAGEPHMPGRAVDERAPLMGPTPLQDHLAVELAGQSLVGREAIADQDHGAFGRTEQDLRDLGAARGVDVVVDRVPAHRGPQPGPAGAPLLAIRLNAPCRLVSVAQRRAVLMREDRLGQRLEQRHEALDAVGQRPRRDRQPHIGQPGRDPMQGTAADEAFVEHAHPDADPVGRVVEQPRHRRRGHIPRRGGALAGPAPARPDDSVLVSLDIDLEESGAPLAVGGIGLAATRTYARILRRVATFLLLPEAGALGAPVPGGAALLAALAPGARLLLPLALADALMFVKHSMGR